MTARVAAAVGILGLAGAVIFLSLYAVRAERPTASPSPTAAVAGSPTAVPTPTRALTPTPTAPQLTARPTVPAATPSRGEITGALGFPSQFIPPLTVYAISTSDERYFSVDTPRYPLPTNTPPKPSYTITGVVPGTYYVLAFRNDDDPLKERPGVYSQYVLCGGTASCTDHTLVPVTVRAGETVSRIDVIDWYYPQGTRYPARPR